MEVAAESAREAVRGVRGGLVCGLVYELLVRRCSLNRLALGNGEDLLEVGVDGENGYGRELAVRDGVARKE